MDNDTPKSIVDRFMECKEGRQFLEGIRAHLKGHRIEEVTFKGNEAGITTILYLSNGESYVFDDDELCLEMLREQFSGLFRELARQ